jgi:phosphatidylglycerol:prolipoprotein diacylglycerol transferase
MGIVADYVTPVFFELGSIKVYYFGFFLAMAFLVTQKLLEIEFKKHGIHVDTTNILIAAAIGGIVGAKLHSVITWDPEGLFNMNTGFSFQGGLLGGALLVAGYIKYCGENVGNAAEDVAALIPLGHAIGKLGCHFSGDGCYGIPTNLPWGMSFPNGLNPTRKFVHPAPLYEFAMSFSIFAYYYFSSRGPRRPWDIFTRVITWLCLTRVAVELWRDHPYTISIGPVGITQFQIFALFAALCVQVTRYVISKTLWSVAAKKAAAAPVGGSQKGSKKTN